MTGTDWNRKFGDKYIISLSSEERKYMGLSELSPHYDTLRFYSKTNFWYTRVTAFFDGSTIIKVISENKAVADDGSVGSEYYQEYDTNLPTAERRELLPLTSRGKPKTLSASNINSVTPFGCSFTFSVVSGEDSRIWLSNPRANKEFPVGERDAIASIRSEADFHSFMRYYISTCPEDYFDKLGKFMAAKKVTVKYRPGDIFRMELDRRHYCYGIITADIKKLKKMPELPENHSLRQLMMVPVMLRMYALVTDNPNMSARDLSSIPLGRVITAGDNDIIWGTHTIVDHKTLEPDDLEFNFICAKLAFKSPHITAHMQDMLIRDGLIPTHKYVSYIEWGFAQTILPYEQMSEKLKELLSDYSSPHGTVRISISPLLAVPDEKHRQYPAYRNNLLNPHNHEILNEIFACLGLEPDTDFDSFAKKFGGLTRQEIIDRMAPRQRPRL